MATRKIISPQSKVSINRALARSRSLNYGRTADADVSKVSYLNDILYRGRADRLERYRIYDGMDMDLDIARALDVISEHCTGKDPDTKMPIRLTMDEEEITSYDSEILVELLKQWNHTNDWDNRIKREIRNVIKYGDAFFIRDPDTYLLHSIKAEQVVGAYVNGKREIEAYQFKDLDFELDCMNFDAPNVAATANVYGTGTGWSPVSTNGMREHRRAAIVDSEHVVHLSLAEGLLKGGNGQTNDIWPFGQSFLEQVYKDYKQRDLLESAALIHRIQRAPSRRVWYVDVGKMRADKANTFLKRFRDNLMTKMFPNTMGGQNAIDSTYNPTAMMEDYFLPTTSTGRGSKVENLEGSQWDSMKDLEYWTDKILRGLRVPSSFMQGPESGGSSWNDGQMGIAYMAEMQFSRFCEGIQSLIDNPLEYEFKLYMKWRGVQVHAADFGLEFMPPMNFEEYREAALDDGRLNRMSQAFGMPSISKRMAFIKYGSWSQEDVLQNEQWWMEEQQPDQARETAQDNETGGMGMGGGFFSPTGGAGGFGDDFGAEEGMPGQDGGLGGGGAGVGAAGGPGAAGGVAAAGGAGGAQGLTQSASVDIGRKKALLERRVSAVYGTKKLKSATARILMAEDIDEFDDVPEDRQDESPEAVPVDGNLKDIGLDPSKPRLTIAHLRKMRIERERNRRELLKRLRLVHAMYGQAPESSSGF